MKTVNEYKALYDALPESEKEALQRNLWQVFVCPICGLQKGHSRLYGYRCSNPEHQRMEDELNELEFKRKFKR